MSGPSTQPWLRTGRRVTSRFVASERAPLPQVLKASGAAVATWFVCLLIFPEQLPIFGAIAALLCVQESVNQSLTRGIERVVGVLLGVSVALGAGAIFGTQSWLFIAAILVAMTVGWALRMTSSSAVQIAITALLMIALGGQEFHYGVERLVETLIGAVIGVVVNALVVAPVRTSPVHQAVSGLVLETSAALDRLANALSEPRDEPWLDDMLTRARALQQDRTEVHALLRRARESLRLNPRGPKYRTLLAADDELFLRVQPIVTQVIGMSRALYDLYDTDLVTDPSVIGMVEEMRRAAHDLALLVRPDLPESEQPPQEPPALTAPYTIPRPHPVHWMLIGSLMEDLRRIRQEITGAVPPGAV
ncbi:MULTISPECIES: FUSC family protein [unclassified Leucobacter]|uniref:FUSC family protein n=1 Tax=unclassified Leucobacter TaxID=2621730 RepID=UPI00165E9F8D|nr:FUSC family protein [Leucobacter sp. cx-87]